MCFCSPFNALKLLTDVEDRGDVRVIQTAIRELRYAFKLFAPYANVRKVTIFGSARTLPSKAEYQQAVDLGRKIVEAGFMVITGAGPGIMQAGHEGAGPGKKFRRQHPAAVGTERQSRHSRRQKTGHLQILFHAQTDFHPALGCHRLFPGGFGTMDEGYEALTLMQTGKSQLMPLVLIEKPGGTYWKTWDKNVREHLLRNQLISSDDLHLYHITDDTDQAVSIITRFYRNFHSSRFVKDLFVIRLKHAPSPSAIEAMNEDFADIIAGEKIKVIEATPEEREDDDEVKLARIAFGFDRRHYGRLRQLIDVLNGL